MGDFNIDMDRKESGMKARLQSDTRSQIISKGWRQMISEATRKMRAVGKDWYYSMKKGILEYSHEHYLKDRTIYRIMSLCLWQ